MLQRYSPGLPIVLVLLAYLLGDVAERVHAGAEQPDRDAVKREFLDVAERITAGTNRYWGRATTSNLRRRLENSGMRPFERVEVLVELSLSELRHGQTAAALTHVDKALTMLRQRERGAGPDPRLGDAIVRTLRTRGLAYMRLSVPASRGSAPSCRT